MWTHKQPHGQRVTDLVAYAHEILDLYEGYADPLAAPGPGLPTAQVSDPLALRRAFGGADS